MARLLTFGAETQSGNGNSLEATSVSGTVTYDSSIVHGGLFSYKCDASAGSSCQINTGFTATASTTVYCRTFMYVTGRPTAGNTINVLLLGAASLTASIFLGLNSSGQLVLSTNTGVVLITSSAISSNAWHRVEVKAGLDASANITSVELVIDGTTQGTNTTSVAMGTNAYFRVGAFTSTFASLVYHDDCAVNDSTGTDQNSYPGGGTVVYLPAVADNSVGSGWTNDAAGTTNLFNAVDNDPPAGIADTTASTGLHQIRNAANNTNAYAATMKSYVTAGASSSQTTAAVVLARIQTGAPSATSAKSGSLTLSNPTRAKTSFGTFYQGSATAGTWPTGWKATTVLLYSQTVAPSTAPVATITQDTGSTRVAMVCEVAMLAELAPAAAAPPPPPVRSILQAVNRVSTY